MEVKTCSKCKQMKYRSEFSKSTRNKDGLQSQCKACAAAYSAAWYKDHHEERAAYNVARREKHAAWCSAWYVKHREEKLASNAAWRAKNPDKAHACSTAWNKANPDKRYAIEHRRQARK